MSTISELFGEPSKKIYDFRDSPGTLLLDASTVEHLARRDILSGLTGSYFSHETIGPILEAMLRQHAASGIVHPDAKLDLLCLSQGLSFLEQWVLADRVVVDRSAVESICQHKNLGEVPDIRKVVELLFEPVDIHSSRCREAAGNVIAFQDYAADEGLEVFEPAVHHPIWDYDLCLKDDYMARFNGLLGQSTNKPGRALFYFELSRILDVPLLLHPRKTEYLTLLGQALDTSWHRTYLAMTKAIKSELKFEETELPIPPLADEILRLAKGERCSLVEAAKFLHQSKEMIALRRLTQEVGTLSTRHRNVESRRMLNKEAASIASAIESRQSADTRISRRTVNLAVLPTIGWVLRLIGKGEISVPDLVLSEQPYVALFSRWANSVQQYVDHPEPEATQQ
ncbi:MAG: hypothetical protein H7A55_08030 [Verrucomicrobiaceae bacterium]|nr:hypothetical protein [Verrucomicrobiaceae bacterium]